MLTGGSTPRPAYEEFAKAARAVALDLRTPRCGSATSAACRPTTSARTTGWSRRRCSTRSATPRRGRAADPGRARACAGRRRVRARAREAGTAAVRPGAARHRARRAPRVAVSRPGVAVRALATGGRSSRGGARAVRPARQLDPAGARARRQVVFLVIGHVEGRRRRRGVRSGRRARPARPVVAAGAAGQGARRCCSTPAAAGRL